MTTEAVNKKKRDNRRRRHWTPEQIAHDDLCEQVAMWHELEPERCALRKRDNVDVYEPVWSGGYWDIARDDHACYPLHSVVLLEAVTEAAMERQLDIELRNDTSGWSATLSSPRAKHYGLLMSWLGMGKTAVEAMLSAYLDVLHDSPEQFQQEDVA